MAVFQGSEGQVQMTTARVSAGLCRPRAYLNKMAYEILISCSLVCFNTELEKSEAMGLGKFWGAVDAENRD